MTLDLKGTNVRELPSEIFKLQRLRYLLVYKSEFISEPPIFKVFGFYGLVGIGSLVNLQELFFIDVNQGGVVVKEMGRLSKLRRVGILGLRREDGPELCSSIEKMRNLRWLSVESLEEKVLDVQYLSSPPPLLQTIELIGKLEKFPNWISLLHNLKKILLMGCTSREDPLEVLQALPNLTELKLNGAYDGDELCFRAGGFQTLKILHLSKFKRLNLVRVEEGAMPHLEELNIFECKMLEKVRFLQQDFSFRQPIIRLPYKDMYLRCRNFKIPTARKVLEPEEDKYKKTSKEYREASEPNDLGFYGQVGIGSLVNLQELFFIEVNEGGVVVKELGRLSKLRRVGISGLRREDGPELCSSIEKMRNLRWLSVESLEKKVLDVQYLSSPPPLLQRIELIGKLEKFPKWISLLHNLKKIYLEGCTSREDPLEVLQALPNLKELKLDGAYDGDELCFKTGGFQTLNILSLSKFERLKLVRVEEGAMPHLEKLTITECKMLEKVPLGIECHANLKFFYFKDMPNEFMTALNPSIQLGHYWRLVNWRDRHLKGHSVE
ncbi:hypothetical protein HHK36_031539 [Tetracentron sinense]|uniref:Disease resistance R13L4/SHOC-2-like LRR domain-containing protein n=1 Tax=Tetracentron sinense TaxID=13715 RepID=A0A835CXZ4_TETSI|nr:hypothetical protein HHK36_031539 [Tetracentron sinense]